MSNDYLGKYIAEKERADRLEATLRAMMTDKEFLRAEHMHHLERLNKSLKHNIRIMQDSAEHLNRKAYATGLIVNCTGCERGGPLNGNELTEDRVRAVEGIAIRLRTWWTNHAARMAKSLPPAVP